MDKAQEDNGSAEEESGQYLWLAGALVGGFLILMIVLIGILLWKHVKKQQISIDQNWAGPSPLANGNINEEGNCMNSSILGRSMSLSQISTSPIFSNEHLTVQEVHEMDEEMQHRNFEENKTNETKLTCLNTKVSAAPMKDLSLAQGANIATQITGKGSNDDTFPPPPLDLPQEFPHLPDPEDLRGHYLRPAPETKSHQQENSSPEEPFNLQLSDMDALHITNNWEDQLLPPPPPHV